MRGERGRVHDRAALDDRRCQRVHREQVVVQGVRPVGMGRQNDGRVRPRAPLGRRRGLSLAGGRRPWQLQRARRPDALRVEPPCLAAGSASVERHDGPARAGGGHDRVEVVDDLDEAAAFHLPGGVADADSLVRDSMARNDERDVTIGHTASVPPAS